MSATLPANLTEAERGEIQAGMGQGLSLGTAYEQMRKRQAREAERARRDGTAPLAPDVLAELAELQERSQPGTSTAVLLQQLRAQRLAQLRAMDSGGISQAEADALLDESWFADPPPLSDEEQRRRGRLKMLLTGWLKREPDLTLAQARFHLQECQMSHGELIYTSTRC
jgi:hypothetical protein